MVSYDLDPSTKSRIVMKLYTNVKNSADIRKKLIQGDLKCGVVKPSLIVDPFQVVIAANKALTAEKMTTKSVYTEILFILSISKNISQSLQKFGIGDDDTEALVIFVSEVGSGDSGEDVFAQIKGEELEITRLVELTDLATLKKTYKINDEESKIVPIVDSVISRIATKDFVSH